MNKQQAEAEFRENVLPQVVFYRESDGVIDNPARAESWNNFTDYLCKDGQITDRQYATWTHPRWLFTLRPSWREMRAAR